MLKIDFDIKLRETIERLPRKTILKITSTL